MKILALLLFLLISCPAGYGAPGSTQATTPPRVTIRQALSNPELVGREIIVTGKVISVVAVGPLGCIRVNDGTGTIVVAISTAVPRDGEHIQLDGLVQQIFVIGHRREILLYARSWHPAPPHGTSNKPTASRR